MRMEQEILAVEPPLFDEEIDKGNSYPSWYYFAEGDLYPYTGKHGAKMREDVERGRRHIEAGDGILPHHVMGGLVRQQKQLEARYERLRATIPKPNEKQKAALDQLQKKLGEFITENYLTEYQETTGRGVQLEEWNDKLVNFWIPINQFKITEALCQAFQVRCEEGLISFNGLIKMWKMARKLIGLPTMISEVQRQGDQTAQKLAESFKQFLAQSEV